MTTFDYAKSARTSERLLRKFGAVGAIRRTTTEGGSSFEPGTEVITAYSSRDIDGTRIMATDQKALLEPALGIEPTTSDLLVTADGSTLTIVNVDVLRPSTTTVLWKLQVRR